MAQLCRHSYSFKARKDGLRWRPPLTSVKSGGLVAKIGKRWIERKFPVQDEFAPELDAFAAAIQKNVPVECDGAQGLRDLMILEAIYNAARKGRSLVIDYSAATRARN